MFLSVFVSHWASVVQRWFCSHLASIISHCSAECTVYQHIECNFAYNASSLKNIGHLFMGISILLTPVSTRDWKINISVAIKKQTLYSFPWDRDKITLFQVNNVKKKKKTGWQSLSRTLVGGPEVYHTFRSTSGVWSFLKNCKTVSGRRNSQESKRSVGVSTTLQYSSTKKYLLLSCSKRTAALANFVAELHCCHIFLPMQGGILKQFCGWAPYDNPTNLQQAGNY